MNGCAPWLGFVLGPAAWAAAFMTSYALVPWQCASGALAVPAVFVVGILLAGAGAFVSWRAWAGGGMQPPAGGRPRLFVSAVSAGVAAVFAFAMLLQLLASLIFRGCEL